MPHLSTYFTLEEAAGAHGVKRLKEGLDTLPGVTSVSVSDSGCVASGRSRSARRCRIWASC